MAQARHLAAIMFADIMGYTALMEYDEAKAREFRLRLKQKLESLIPKHHGQVIKWMGDGVLCSFDSAIESVRTAMALQEEMQQEPVIPLRIGIHQADVIFEDSDVHGDGVNIAARLESMALPGSIFVSAKVFDDIKNQADISAVSLGKYSLKNVKEPVEIYAVNYPGAKKLAYKKLEGKGVKYVSEKISIRKRVLLLRSLVMVIAIIAAGYLVIPPVLNKGRARNKILPRIQELVDNNFRPPTEAFDLALRAKKYIPKDSTLIKLWNQVSTKVSMVTEPSGAEVYWKDYHTPDAEWRIAGTTPLKDASFPRGYLRIEVRKEGYQTIKYAGPSAISLLGSEIDTLTLDVQGTIPPGMVRIPPGQSMMNLVGLEQHGGKEVPPFLMDDHEVTNKAFKKFVDEGGYSNKKFWEHQVLDNGKVVVLDEALKLFVDKTGRPGPAGWEAGTYPDGMDEHPVTGVSWYEAAAYASFAGKQLPTIFHWESVAETNRTEFLVPLSNFNGKSTRPVSQSAAFSSFGIYDLAGNAREWCQNESDLPGFRYILGGGWNDPSYSFNDSYTQPATDRSVGNGFRCIRLVGNGQPVAALAAPVAPAFRDYRKEKPVDDKTFAIYLNQFTYDKSPLNEKLEAKMEEEQWTIEKITLDAGYNNERLEVYLYIPKGFAPPYQAVLFFPGSGDIYSKKYKPESINNRIDFILKSGRAIARPIYKGTHERHDELDSDLPDESVFYKDHVIMWRKDIGRTLDLLESRKDISSEKIGYLGWSWGGYMGGIMPAIEQRLKAIVLNVGGMVMNKSLPEVDQLNFLPRVKQPVLMLNGKHDMFFPVETSQKPMFGFLGTEPADKKFIIYEAGHLVPRTDFVKETLFWYDKYLGPVK
jgi:formylglycine-generating enzyme required for sulfatase activity/dienelactone hydrolase